MSTNEATMVKAQVIAAGVSYFEEKPLLGPSGSPRTAPNGEVIYTTLRKEALQGDIVKMSPAEFDRISDLGGVRTPSDAPIRPSVPIPTPFGVPLRDDGGNLVAHQGPFMGDPSPQGSRNPDDPRDQPTNLTSEEYAAQQEELRLAAEKAASFEIEDASAEEIKEYLDREKPNVETTIALAKVGNEFDEQLVERVYEAETSREKPRAGVVSVLEEASASFLEDEEDDEE